MHRFIYFLLLACFVIGIASCSGDSSTPVTPDGDTSGLLTRPGPASPEGRIGATEGDPVAQEPARAFNAIMGPRSPHLETSITEGLDYLISVRTTLTYCTGTDYADVWPFYVGAVTPSPNIPGNVCASLLLAAPTTSGYQSYYYTEAMKTVDNYIMPAFSPSGCSATSRPYAETVYSLYLAWKHTGNASYLDKAYELAGRTTTEYTGSAYADRILDLAQRNSLSGWDAAAYIFSWYLVGDAKGDSSMTGWAIDLADQIIARMDEWEYSGWVGTGGTWTWDSTMLSYGGMMKALVIVDHVGYSSTIDYMRCEVLAAQDADGWWPMYYLDYYGLGIHYITDDVQATAYVLEGLNYDNKPLTMFARFGGENYLRSADIQQADGSFLSYIGDSPPVNAEVSGEALRGLASMPYGVIESDTNRKVTGGGWIDGLVSGKANFGFSVKVMKDGELQGTVRCVDEDSGIDFEATDMTTLSVYENTTTGYFFATVAGTGMVNDEPADFVIAVEDNGEPGSDDSFSISIGDYVNNGGTLGGGNIKVHKN